MRAAVLTSNDPDRHAALVAVLRGAEDVSGVHHVARARLASAAMLLLRHRPGIVVAEASGSSALLAALYRILLPGSRLLARLPRSGGHVFLRRLAVACADGVLAEHDTPQHRARRPVFTVSAPPGLDPFFACPLPRPAEAAHRIAYVGPLSPSSGAADVLLCLGAWAERNAGRQVAIDWCGEGDLAGVLEAQPLPENLAQRFLGPLDEPALAEAFARCGLWIGPLRQAGAAHGLARALAAGLVPLRPELDARWGPFRGAPGWTFGAERPADLLQAVTAALDTPAEQLDPMREAARAMAQRAATAGFNERVLEALAAVLPARRLPASGHALDAT